MTCPFDAVRRSEVGPVTDRESADGVKCRSPRGIVSAPSTSDMARNRVLRRQDLRDGVRVSRRHGAVPQSVASTRRPPTVLIPYV